MNIDQDLQQEWRILHNNCEQYEAYGLMIKLVAVVLFLLSISLKVEPIITLLIIAVLWLQEAIWRTFQSRIEHRILALEAAIKHNNALLGHQLYSEWVAQRPNTVSLIASYFKQGLRPTVAFPYLVFMVFIVVIAFAI